MAYTNRPVSGLLEEVAIPDGAPVPGTVYVRVSLTEKNAQKCLQFHLDQSVWKAKQLVLSNMGADLKDPLNYGLYWPPQNGRNGKFLQEERPLRDYPLQGPIGFLEFKYKRRSYQNAHISLSKLKKLHTKGNLRQFLELVKNGDVAKVTKWLNKGIDPNFHCKESGETPMTLAAKREKPRELLMALASGGSHIDFRARDAMTPLHRAAVCGNYDAIRAILDLGQNPNCLDHKGLTPLYYTVVYDTRAICAEVLLYDHSVLGIADEHGLQEVHQVCRYGRSQHLEHLISYGADINAKTKNGNTPLHICALTQQDSCARLLLFRGADRTLENNNGETPHQIALLSKHLDIAQLISNFQEEDVVELKISPKFNQRRRSSVREMRADMRCSSLNRLPDFSGDSAPGTTPVSHYATATVATSGHRPLGNASSMSRSAGSLLHGQTNGSIGDMRWMQEDDSRSSSIGNQNSIYASPHRIRASLMPLFDGDMTNFPRTVVLQKGAAGFGFVLRGCKASNTLDFRPSPELPALQYFENIQPGSPADKAGMKKGDYVLEINGECVVTASHEHVVQMIRSAGDTLPMKVVTVDRNKLQQQAQVLDQLDQTLAEYDDSISLRSGYMTPRSGTIDSESEKTSSLRGRPVRPMPDSELTTGSERVRPVTRPDIPLTAPPSSTAPSSTRIYAEGADFRAKLRSNAQLSQQQQTQQQSDQLPATPVSTFPRQRRPAPPPPMRTTSTQGPTTAALVHCEVPTLPNRVPTEPAIHEIRERTSTDSSQVYANTESLIGLPEPETRPIQEQVVIQNVTNDSSSSDHVTQIAVETSQSAAVAVVSKTIESIEEPPPDYSDSEEESENAQQITSGFQAMLLAAVHKREAKQKEELEAAKVAKPTAQSIPTTESNQSEPFIPPPPPPPPPMAIPPPPPPPPPMAIPPPPPPPPPTAPPATVSLNTKRSPAPAPDPAIDHAANLRAVIARRRQKIDLGENPAAHVEDKVSTGKVATRSVVFTAASAKPTNPVETRPKPTNPVETRPKSTNPIETRPKPTNPVETRPKPTNPVEMRPKATNEVTPSKKAPQNAAHEPTNGTTTYEKKAAVTSSEQTNFRNRAEQLRQQALQRRSMLMDEDSSETTKAPAQPRGSIFFAAGGGVVNSTPNNHQ